MPGFIRASSLAVLLAAAAISVSAQNGAAPAGPNDAMADAVHELQEQVRELRDAVAEMKAESAKYRAETDELRRELQASRVRPGESSRPSANAAAEEPNAQSHKSLENRVTALEDSTALLNGKIDEQYQTKVSSASKYRVRLSGLALLNVFENRGVTENQDIPTWASTPGPLDPKGNVGASMRQSEIGLEAFGPDVWGARTSANMQLDFSGGFPNTSNGVSFGLVRLRIASMHLDWDRTSIVAGQDNVFVSPLSPTSFASLAVPALTYAGNLWGWIPQVRVEHRFALSDSQSVTVQGGVLDNLNGEYPPESYLRYPQAGESSNQPAYGTRIAWTHDIFGRPLTLGGAGYYGRQNWGLGRHVDGWAGMTDWSVPLGSRLELSGEFYRGRAAGGLGASFAYSVRFNGDPNLATTQVLGINSIGGWSQLKVKATPKLEFNAAWGIDSPFAGEVRRFTAGQTYLPPTLQRNRSYLANFVYRPRSDLLFSAEYRHFDTYYSDNGNPEADHVNLIMGFLF